MELDSNKNIYVLTPREKRALIWRIEHYKQNDLNYLPLNYTISQEMEETTHHLSFKTLLLAYFLICSTCIYATNYYFTGDDNSWGDDLMLLSTEGN